MGRRKRKLLLGASSAAALLAAGCLAAQPSYARLLEEREQKALLAEIEAERLEAAAWEEADEEDIWEEDSQGEDSQGEDSQGEDSQGAASLGTGRSEEGADAEDAASAIEEADELPEDAAAQPPVEGEAVGTLWIGKIDACLPVVAGASEETLRAAEGWVVQSAVIGSVGNAVIAGHRSYTYGRHFNRLGELEAGDIISYSAVTGEEMEFTVREILVVEPGSPSVFAEAPEGTAMVTLYTCTPIGEATHRLLIRAVRTDPNLEEGGV